MDRAERLSTKGTFLALHNWALADEGLNRKNPPDLPLGTLDPSRRLLEAITAKTCQPACPGILETVSLPAAI